MYRTQKHSKDVQPASGQWEQKGYPGWKPAQESTDGRNGNLQT